MNEIFVLNGIGDIIIVHNCRVGFGKSVNSQEICNKFYEIIISKQHTMEDSNQTSDYLSTLNLNNNSFSNNSNNIIQSPIISFIENKENRKKNWFVFEKENGLYFVIQIDDVSAISVSECLVFMKTFKQTLNERLGSEVNEENIRRNFGLIYEILEEMIEGGYPQSDRFLSELLLNDVVFAHSHPHFTFHSNFLQLFIVRLFVLFLFCFCFI
jgi:hypothetical protein